MIHPTLSQLEYYINYRGVSQSMLKGMFDIRKKGTSLPMLYGSYVDCLLTTPNLVDDLFIVTDLNFPSATIQNIFQDAVGEFEDNIPLLLEKARELNYHSNFKDDALIKKLRTHKEYYDIMQTKQNKNVITKDIQESALMLSTVVKSAPNTHHLFVEAPNTEVYFQKAMYYKLNEIECKGLADEIIIDHNKEVITIVDFKFTTMPIKQWGHMAESYDYPMQFSFYKEGVLQTFTDYSGYKIECKWVVMHENATAPWLIQCDDHLLYKFKFGFRDTNGKRVYGWKELLDIYKECDEHYIDPANYFWNKYSGTVNLLTLNND